MSVKYPHDRMNGYVVLTDGDGNPYVPQFRYQDTPKNQWLGYKKYTASVWTLLKRYYGKSFEPSAIKNWHLLEDYKHR